MKSAEGFTREYKLSHGYRVMFKFIDAEKGVEADWEPSFPDFTGNDRARRKFLVVYDRARKHFMQDVANLIEGSVLDVAMTADGDVVATPIHPETKQ